MKLKFKKTKKMADLGVQNDYNFVLGPSLGCFQGNDGDFVLN